MYIMYIFQKNLGGHPVSHLDVLQTSACQGIFKQCLPKHGNNKDVCCLYRMRECMAHSGVGACGLYCGCWYNNCIHAGRKREEEMLH